MKLTKRRKSIEEILNKNNIEKNESYDIDKVIESLKSIPNVKFKNSESLDVSIKLGIDPTKSDQVIRSSSSLPHGNGKKIRVAVFAVPVGKSPSVNVPETNLLLLSVFTKLLIAIFFTRNPYPSSISA